jgi:hypothetical protein
MTGQPSYTPQAPGSLFFASHDLQGYDGVALTSLHTGGVNLMNLYNIKTLIVDHIIKILSELYGRYVLLACWIWGSHSGNREKFCFLECDAVWPSRSSPKFRKNISLHLQDEHTLCKQKNLELTVCFLLRHCLALLTIEGGGSTYVQMSVNFYLTTRRHTPGYSNLRSLSRSFQHWSLSWATLRGGGA